MTLNISELSATWQKMHALAHDGLIPITNEAEYDRALVVLDALLKQVGEDEQHPLADFLESLIGRVMAYQETAQHIPPPAPDMHLRLLMKKHGYSQIQVSEGTGLDQGLISRLASGKRRFTADHARKLGKFFGVNPGEFL